MFEYIVVVGLYIKGVCGIIDYVEVVVVGYFLNCVDVVWMFVVMYWYDCCCLRCDCCFDFCWVEIECVWIDIDEYWFDVIL